MASRFRTYDWTHSALGPVQAWPAALRSTVATMLDSPVPMALAWGREGRYLYNDAIAALLGQRHPAGFAQPMVEVWSEIARDVSAMLEDAFAGRSVQLRRLAFELHRDGPSESVLFDVDCSPVRGDDGAPAGMLVVVRELARESAVRAAEELGHRERCLLALSDALRDLTDPGEIHDVAALLLGAHLGVDRIGHVEADGGGLVVRECSDDGTAAVAWPAAVLGDCLFGGGRVTRAAVFDDVAREPLLDTATRTLLAAHDIGALAAPAPRAPVIDRFVALSRAPRRWTTSELDLLREVGERVQAATERARVKIALASSEERFRAVAEQAEVGVALADRDGRLVYVNDRHCEVTGLSREALIDTRIRAITHPDDRALSAQQMDALYRTGTPFTVEKRIGTRDAPRWIRITVGPWRDPSGTVVGSLAISLDLTSRRQAEQALRDSEARFRQFGDASSDVLWIRNARTLEVEYLSPAFETIYGQQREVSLRDPRYWMTMVHPDDAVAVRANARRVRGGARSSIEFRIIRPADGRVVWIRNTDFPLYDEEGRLQRIGGIGRDITRERDDAALMETLVAELQHRTRNLIAVIQSLARRTQQESRDIDGFGRSFNRRLDALGRVQALLSRRADGEGVSFDALLGQELDAHGIGPEGDPRVRLQGPAGVPLRARAVQILALALHELTTNALKHGALSNAGGRLAIRWAVDTESAEPLLGVEWEESGVLLAPVERANGYGRELIERALPYQLNAQTRYELRDDGVYCTIRVPLNGLAQPPDPA